MLHCKLNQHERRQTSLSEAWLIAGPTSSKKPVVTAEDDEDRPEMLDLSQASAAQYWWRCYSRRWRLGTQRVGEGGGVTVHSSMLCE